MKGVGEAEMKHTHFPPLKSSQQAGDSLARDSLGPGRKGGAQSGQRLGLGSPLVSEELLLADYFHRAASFFPC